MATAVTPPPLQGPTAKERKYDRQLRLWAASGQQALEDAHILLLNSGAGVVGVETLKNLVLPGVGNFMIVDEQTVREEDLGVNFFLEEESLGKSRAAECCKFLRELNPEVNGHAIHQPIESFISANDLTKYSLILLVAPAKLSKVVQRVSNIAWAASIPLFYIHSNGFYSQFSIQLPPLFPIVDTHPDPESTQDIRLLNPWPALLDHMRAKTTDLETMSDHDHGHIPYLLLLLHYLEARKESHGGKYPESYKEKTEFRSIVDGHTRRNNPEGGEENFEEAVGAVLKSLNAPSIPSGLRELFEESICIAPESDSANFWIIAHALHLFVLETKALPLPGTLPDMKAQSADYIALQTLYKAKANTDAAKVTSEVRKLEKRLNRSQPIESKEIDAFCKNAAFVKIVHGQKLRLATEPTAFDFGDRARYVLQQLGDEESQIAIYLALLGLDYYLEQCPKADFTPHAKRPLNGDQSQSKFKSAMDQYIGTVLANLKTLDADFEIEEVRERVTKVVAELDRAGNAELHNISALTGGMVAQEVIKVLTKQYVPVNNTCIFDGISSRVGVFRL